MISHKMIHLWSYPIFRPTRVCSGRLVIHATTGILISAIVPFPTVKGGMNILQHRYNQTLSYTRYGLGMFWSDIGQVIRVFMITRTLGSSFQVLMTTRY